MHKLEQVSVMTGTSHQRADILKRTEKLARLRISGDSINEEAVNDNMSVFDEFRTAEKIIDQQNPLSEDMTQEEAKRLRLTEFLKTYKLRDRYDPKLPITKSREEILRIISENRFSVILGGTGCGKTTQVSRFIISPS